MADSKDNKEQNTAPQIDTIRNILFGHNMEEYEDRFERLEAKIESNHNELLQKQEAQATLIMQTIHQLDEKLSHSIAVNKADSDKKYMANDEEKVNRKQLGDLLVALGKELSS